MVPGAVLAIGGHLLERVSGLARYADAVKLPFIHTRFAGYDIEAVRTQSKELGTEGLAAYRRMLRWDLLFPIVYGSALIWTITRLWALIAPDTPTCTWVFLLPLVTMVADWSENIILLSQTKSLAEKPSPGAIRVASRAPGSNSSRTRCAS